MLTEFRFARLAGIDIAAHWSLPVVLMLIGLSLGAGILPTWHPDWPPLVAWGVALATALLFAVSVLAREMAHGLASRLGGANVRRITLFMFGGVTHLERRPPHWRAELVAALAAPVVTALVMLACTAVTTQASRDLPDIPGHALFLLGPAGTLFLWLGQLNLTLLLFNLLPGFPLDGGRLLRALLWALTGDLRRASRWMSRAGQAWAWLLVMAGIAVMLGVPLLSAAPVVGAWLLMTGAVLYSAAGLGNRRAWDGAASLDGIPVERLMHSDFASVRPDMSIAELVDNYVLPGVEHTFPVLDEGRFAGLVSLQDLSKVPREAWPRTPVREVMTPATGVTRVRPGTDAADAMVTLGREAVHQLPVIENGRLRGLISREDILQRLSRHGDPALAQ